MGPTNLVPSQWRNAPRVLQRRDTNVPSICTIHAVAHPRYTHEFRAADLADLGHVRHFVGANVAEYDAEGGR